MQTGDHGTRTARLSEAYRIFIDFIGNDVQRERRRDNRRMFSVFFWCFLAPAILTFAFLFLIKLGVLPYKAKANIDWLILICPVIYSIYVVGSEVVVGIPSMFKKGGLATSLRQARQDGEWRERVCESIRVGQSGHPTPLGNLNDSEWEWVIASFQVDLENLRYRTKYLTALAGAVFFLVMQGIDSLNDVSESVWLKNPLQGWVEASNNVFQLMALALFLVLLYLSGNQTYHSLSRYLECAKLVQLQRKPAARG